jgi:predicted RNA-binding Zn ribbon-like protein
MMPGNRHTVTNIRITLVTVEPVHKNPSSRSTTALDRHPTDSEGLPLPDGSWPDRRGSAGALEVVRRFCNSINREHGADAWRTADQLHEWLILEGFSVGTISSAQLDKFREWRDTLLAAITEHSIQPLQGILSGLALRPAVVDGRIVLATNSHDAEEDVFARIVAALLTSQYDGTWERLKACQRCRWVFFDSSKNRSGRWCTMQACGGRHKAKTYRRRQAARDKTSPSTTSRVVDTTQRVR